MENSKVGLIVFAIVAISLALGLGLGLGLKDDSDDKTNASLIESATDIFLTSLGINIFF